MRILITGATGFLGSQIVRSCVHSGHEVLILKRSFSRTDRVHDLLPQLSVYNLDQCALEQPFLDHGPIDAVIHTATNYGRNHEGLSEIFETNTLFPLRLLDLAIQHKTDVFINSDTTLDKFMNSYAFSKKQFMEWGKLAANNKWIRFINMKLEHFYGHGDDPSKFTTHVIQSCINNVAELKLTEGIQQRDFIHIDDAVSAFSLILHKYRYLNQAYLEYEIGSGEAVSIRHFVETVHRITNSRTALAFGAYAYRENEVMFTQAHIEALQWLGWTPRYSLEEGLRATIYEEKPA
jgi:CDP-paratose synthetase